MQDQDKDSPVSQSSELRPYDVKEYHFQINDVVDVTMKTTSAELNEMLNIKDNSTQLRSMDGLTSGDAFFLTGYTIDNDGLVELPLVGSIKLVGMDVQQAKAAIEEKLIKYVNKENLYVRVRLGGIRYSAIGEFNRPGKFTILQNRLTIFEAIANAGDMTSAAKRSEIVLIRQYPDGVKTHTINLLNKKIMDSEFFFIQPNDMIYARPMKVKQIGAGITLLESFEVLLSIATVILLYANVVD